VLVPAPARLQLPPAEDPLPSWNDTAPKKAIAAFVAKVTKEGSPDFTSAEREVAYDRRSRFGRLDRGPEEAAEARPGGEHQG
jgi:hypothetical protein